MAKGKGHTELPSVIWMRDLDGTGSMHPCAKGDPGAIAYVPEDFVNTYPAVEGLVKALEFYSQLVRYEGPNQRPIENDPYAKPDDAYRRDVTRDGGEIARSALSRFRSLQNGEEE